MPCAPPQLVRAALDALAAAHTDVVRDLERLTGTDVGVVGGGSRNRLLYQATALGDEPSPTWWTGWSECVPRGVSTYG